MADTLTTPPWGSSRPSARTTPPAFAADAAAWLAREEADESQPAKLAVARSAAAMAAEDVFCTSDTSSSRTL
jgi:hypothetical protein